MIEVVYIGLRDGLILFPLVVGVGLLYSQLRVLDVSVDGVAIACGIMCAYAWRESGSYTLSFGTSILLGAVCSCSVCVLIAVFSIHPIMAGLIFSIAVHAVSVVFVGESIGLEGTTVLSGMSTIPLWLPLLSIAVTCSLLAFLRTRIGSETTAYGTNPLFRTSHSPVVLQLTAYAISGGLYGLAAAMYVHSQGLARGGGGFDFLVLSLCSYLSLDRLVVFLTYLLYRICAHDRSDTSGVKVRRNLLAAFVRSVPFKAFIGAVFFQIVVLLTIMHSPSPSLWKLILAGVLAACLVAVPARVFTGLCPFKDKKSSHIGADLGKEHGLSVKCLSKTYDLGIEKRVVFDNATVVFRRGINVVRGPNGAGKSTLLGLLAGTCEIDGGRILFDAVDVTCTPSWRRPTYLIRQNPFQTLAPELPVVANIALAGTSGGSLGGLSWRRAIDNLFGRLADLAIEPIAGKETGFWQKPAFTLSGGQASAVAFYMAIVSEKPIILADEPSTGLDEENFHRLLTALQVLRKERIVVVTTHDHRLDSLEGVHYWISKGGLEIDRRVQYAQQ